VPFSYRDTGIVVRLDIGRMLVVLCYPLPTQYRVNILHTIYPLHLPIARSCTLILPETHCDRFYSCTMDRVSHSFQFDSFMYHPLSNTLLKGWYVYYSQDDT
jgi:hypothetical protein